MKTAGEILRAEREKKNLDLAYISDSLKIRVKYLEALEEGRYEVFPSPLYIKGFLKNYAKFLGVSEDEILALYRRDYITKEKNSEQSIFNKNVRTPIKMISFSLKPGYIGALFTGLIVLSILFYLFYEYRQFSAPPSLRVDAPTNFEKVGVSSIDIKGHTNPGNRVLINNSAINNIAINGDFDTTITLHPQSNDITVEAINNLNRTTSIKRTVIYDSSINTIVNPSTIGQTGLSMYGLLSISNDTTWVKITTDGNVIVNGVLSPGYKKTFTAEKEILIQTGNDQTTTLSVNGENIPLIKDGATSYNDITVNQSGSLTFK